jgi:hypothetical protein
MRKKTETTDRLSRDRYSETSLLRTRLLQKPHSWETKSKSLYSYFFVNFISLLRKTHSWGKNIQSLQIRKNEVWLYVSI